MSAPGVDERAMKELAKITKGQYFRAEDTAGLQKIYQIIDELEPTSKDQRFVQEAKDLFYVPLLLAVVLSMLIFYFMRGAK